jgi:hypothetical protein
VIAGVKYCEAGRTPPALTIRAGRYRGKDPDNGIRNSC